MNRRHAFLLVLMAVAAALILWTSRTTPKRPTEPALIPPETVYPNRSTPAPEQPIPTSAVKQAERPALGGDLVDDDVVISQRFPNLGCRRVVTRSSQGKERVIVGCGMFSGTTADTYTKRASTDLETLAETDAEAAMVLAMRSQSFNKPRTMKYVVRAVALGGNDATPLLWYMSNVRSSEKTGNGNRRGTERAKMNYVLSHVAESLGADPRFSRHAHWQTQLSTLDVDADAFASLNQHSMDMLAEIERIQYKAGIAPTTAE